MEENTTLRLNDAERAILKAECKLGNTFFWLGLMAAMLLIILVILFSGNVLVAVVGSLVLLLLGWLIRRSLNKELFQDLANDQKVVVVKPLDRLEMNPHLNPDVTTSNAFNYRLAKRQAGYFVFSGKLKYPVDKATFDQLQGQSQFEFHYAPNSYTLLGIHPVSSR